MHGIRKVCVGGETESAGRGVELKAVRQVSGSRVLDAHIAKGSDLVQQSTLWDSPFHGLKDDQIIIESNIK